MKPSFLFVTIIVPLFAQTAPRDVARYLEPALQTPDVAAYQLQKYLDARSTPLQPPSSAAQWTEQSNRIRRRVLDSIVYHGWPKDWVQGQLKSEDLGPIPSGPGYRMRKIRYEIVPGFPG
jgi:hypothetical protein